MPNLPAKCFNCGHLWVPSSGIRIENSHDIRIGTATINCPRCGGRARIVSGTFSTTHNDGLEVHDAPAWSLEVFAELAEAVAAAEALLAAGVRPRVVERRLNEDLASSPASGLLRHLKRPSNTTVAAWIGAIAAVLAVVQNMGGGGATPEQIHQIYVDVLEQQQSRPADSFESPDNSDRPTESSRTPRESPESRGVDGDATH
jgi:hypothetical protein